MAVSSPKPPGPGSPLATDALAPKKNTADGQAKLGLGKHRLNQKIWAFTFKNMVSTCFNKQRAKFGPIN